MWRRLSFNEYLVPCHLHITQLNMMTGVTIFLLNHSIGKIKFFLMKKAIIVSVNNTKSSNLYDYNSTGKFPEDYTALCYGTVDWEERGQGKPELAVMSLQLCTLLSKVLSVCLWNEKQCCMKECFILLFPLLWIHLYKY